MLEIHFWLQKYPFFNEFYSYIDKLGLDYNEIRNVICDDTRIGDSHTNCPGPDGKKGFAGTGLMNDLLGFLFIIRKYWGESSCYATSINT